MVSHLQAQLHSILNIVAWSESGMGSTVDGDACYTDREALARIRTIARDLLASVDSLVPGPAVAMANPSSQSSVQIESRAKGAPGITVKVYDADPSKAMATASDLYDAAIARYVALAKEPAA